MNNLPPKIYKYHKVDNYSLANLKNSQIFFNSPLNFNDPFDSVHNIFIDELTEDKKEFIYTNGIKNEQQRQIIQKILNCLISKEEFSKTYPLLLLDYGLFSKKGLTILKDYFEHVDKKIITDEDFSICLSELSLDLKEQINLLVKKTFETLRMEQVEKHGITCFSEEYDNLLMWAYYADGHKGFCLEFDTNFDPFNNPMKLKKVKYIDSSPTIDPNSLLFLEEDSDTEFVDKIFATKFINWSHEKEWRLIHENFNQLYHYPIQSLTGIYFGSKIDSTQREIIMTILKSHNATVKFYKMKPVPGEFKIIPELVVYYTPNEIESILINVILIKFRETKFSKNQLDIITDQINPLNQISKDLLNNYFELLLNKSVLIEVDGLFGLNINNSLEI